MSVTYFRFQLTPRIEIQSPTSDEGSLVRDSFTPSSVSPTTSPAVSPAATPDVQSTNEQNRTREFTINQYNRMGVQVDTKK